MKKNYGFSYGWSLVPLIIAGLVIAVTLGRMLSVEIYTLNLWDIVFLFIGLLLFHLGTRSALKRNKNRASVEVNEDN